GRASGELVVEGQTVDVTIVEVARGTVAGFVLQADGATTVPGASIAIRGSSFAAAPLQATTRPDGSFRFDGIAVGTFSLEAYNPQSLSRGTSTGELTFEGQTVDHNVLLAGVATIRVRV